MSDFTSELPLEHCKALNNKHSPHHSCIRMSIVYVGKSVSNNNMYSMCAARHWSALRHAC